MTMTLDEAQRVVLEAREREEEAKTEARRLYVGRYFKYRNSYGVGGKQGPWWLYGAVTGAEPYIGCTGWTFQYTSERELMIDTDAHFYPDHGGWTEISATEFWTAADDLRHVVTALLTHPEE